MFISTVYQNQSEEELPCCREEEEESSERRGKRRELVVCVYNGENQRGRNSGVVVQLLPFAV